MKRVGASVIACGFWLAFACGSQVQEPGSDSAGSGGQPAGAGAPNDDGAGARFGASDCRACQADACAVPEADCASEPKCASYLECLDACPTARDGGVDHECAAECRPPALASLEVLAGAVVACRDTGHAIDCPCGETPLDIDLFDQQCEPSEDPNPCYACEDENCCETYAECKADDDCTAFMDCLKVCPDDFAVCQLDCAEQHPAGVDKGLRRVACVFLYCAEGDQCGEGPLDPCVACVNARCPAENSACQVSLPCQKMERCTAACSTAECFQACYEEDPAAALLFQMSVGCSISSCGSECG